MATRGDCIAASDSDNASFMRTEQPEHAERPDLLRAYERYRDVLAGIIGELCGGIGSKRAQTVLRSLGLASALPTLVRSDRLRSAVYTYMMFTDRRRGRTLLERMESQLRHHVDGVPGGVGRRVLDALLASDYRVLDITRIEPELGVMVRDALSERGFLIVDVRLSQSWEVGHQFAGRVVAMPEFGLLAGEPLETDVRPGQDYSRGRLNTLDQARLEAGLIQAFAEAVGEC